METHWNLFSFLFLRVTTGRLPSKIKLSHLCARICWSFFSRARGERCLRARVVVIGRFVDPRTGAGSAAAILENAHPPVFFAPVGSSSSSVSSRTLAVQELHVGLQSLGRFQADARARSIILLLHHFVVETSLFFFFSIETVVVAVDSRRSQTILCQVLERNDENPIRTPLL